MSQYKKLRSLLQELDEVRVEHNRNASLNTGVISGGIDMQETGDRIIALIAESAVLVSNMITSGCRLSYLKSVVSEYGASRSIQDLIRDAERNAEYYAELGRYSK